MRIVIDMQGAQSTGSRNRGIGRYSLALSMEMARLRGAHEVFLAMNSLFSDTIAPIRATFSDLLPKENICVWEAVGPVSAADKANDARRRVAEITREAFLAGFQPDIVLITSLIEGLGDGAITSIGSFTTQLPTAVILYDLIPLVYRSIYLPNQVVENWYLNKIDHLRRADLLLSISSSSKQEALDYLGIPPESIANISTACDSYFQPIVIDDTKRTYLRNAFGLNRPYVMYTGGIDHRKNIEGLIRAYASLPKYVRAEHQLVVVCSIQEPDKSRLLQMARKEKLGGQDLVFTGFVPENDLITLYNACKLFVLPSWHEGFGLPALEAMACGRAVIGSNTSSIPEVIGRDDALFDPHDDAAIARKIVEVLTNDEYRAELERHCLTQARKFSWEKTARSAWRALETFIAQKSRLAIESTLSSTVRRPRLAYISPLPPEQSGIAEYSAELLPELSKHYEIEVVVAQNEISDPWIRANCPVRDVNWFRSKAHCFERVLYHFGNSHFHSHMFHLLKEFPGVVVLHDFFLSNIVAHLDSCGEKPNCWAQALIHAHGWAALHARYQTKDITDQVWAYPCNLEILQQALGVIVHSEYSRQLAHKWYGPDAANKLTVIPFLRVPAIKTDRHASLRKLGFDEGEFIVCSFGMLGPIKLNHRLLTAWLSSPLANDPHCHLIFVGQNHGGDYGVELVKSIHKNHAENRIKITGWVDTESYRAWHTASNLCVQLRVMSRGETSGAVLDCMNYGLATVVNMHGAMAELPADAVWFLPDQFSNQQLTEALTTLWRDTDRCRAMGKRAQEVIRNNHQPRHCAEQYTQAIERFYQKALMGLPALIQAIANTDPAVPEKDWPRYATVLANNFSPHPRRKRLFLDISELVQRDGRSGIQRVVRALLQELLLRPPLGWIVEPVYATSDAIGYYYARKFTCRFLDIHAGWAEDELVDAWSGDIFLGLDLQPEVVPVQRDYLLSLHRRGVKIYFIVYDLLPVLKPRVFRSGTQANYQRWLETISNFDGAVCISRVVAAELDAWQRIHISQRLRSFKIHWFHLGANVENTVPTSGLPDDTNIVFKELASRPTFLMVGTIEPRKCQTQALDAFELLWKQDVDVNLVIVGKQGWMVKSLVERLRQHAERNKRLFWLEGISDEYLEKIYTTSTCLIAASEGEGFGLSLIESAKHGLPIIARDIPVFREVSEGHAFFFKGFEPQALTEAIRKWLELYRQGQAPRSEKMPRLDWKQSAKQLLQCILGGETHLWASSTEYVEQNLHNKSCGRLKKMDTNV